MGAIVLRALKVICKADERGKENLSSAAFLI
jgi:hypothetical protein